MMAATKRATAPFRILFVCTGNVCRSPMAERMLEHALIRFSFQHELGWHIPQQLTIESAGTRAMVGDPMTEESAVLVRRAEADPNGHFARQLTDDLIERAGLVLALTRDHRRRVVAMLPSASGRTFTLAEFARLLDDVASRGDLQLSHTSTTRAALAELVGAAAARRGHVESPDNPAADDVEDPYLRSAAAYERVDLHLTTLISSIVGSLARLDANHNQSQETGVR
jgi:protein-tyrosine phosphatase